MMIENLTARLQEGFHDTGHALSAASFASFNMWPREDQMEDFGDENVAELMKYFKYVLENDGFRQISGERHLIKPQLRDDSFKVQNLKWENYFLLSVKYPNFLAVIILILTFFVSFVEGGEPIQPD